jgi:outer membrane protein TolC
MRTRLLAGLAAIAMGGCTALSNPQETLERHYGRFLARQAERPAGERIEVSEPKLAAIVREHNRTVKSREFQYLAAKERYGAQQADYLPQLRLTTAAGIGEGPERTASATLLLEQRLPGGYLIAPSVTRDDSQLTTYALAVTLPIPFLSRGGAEDRLTRLTQLKELSRAAADYAGTFRSQFRSAASAYYEVATLQTLVGNQKEFLQRLKQVGDILGPNPPAQYQSDLASAESALAGRRAQLADAKARLNRSLGLPLDQKLAVELPEPKPLPQDQPALARAAVQADPDLIDAAYQLAVDDASIAAAREGWLPKLTLSGDSTVDPRGDDAWSATLGLDFTLFDSGKRGHQARQAEHGKRATELRLEQRMADIQYDIHRAFLALQDTSERLPLLKTNVDRAKEAVDEGIDDFRAKKTTYGALLPQLAALRDARDGLAGTLRSYAENRTLLELQTGAYDRQ